MDVRRLGCELVARAIADARRRGGFDVIVQTGDIIDMPGELTFQTDPAPEAELALAEVRGAIDAAAPDVPVVVVPGNHDGPPDRVFAAFGQTGPVREIAGYRFVALNDYAPGSLGARCDEDLALIERLAAEATPLIVVQHNPVLPLGERHECLSNGPDVRKAYARAGVLLSISCHLHVGQPVQDVDGVHYFTTPGLFTSPRRYALVTLRGRDVRVQTVSLDVVDADPPVVDMHAHTEFAYCSQEDLTAQVVVDRSRMFDLSGVVLAEHVPQLYCTAEDFWNAQHIFEPHTWRRPEHSRMDRYTEAIDPLRSDFVHTGFEVELDVDGCLTITDADREWADLLVGAVHWLTVRGDGLSDADAARVFMDNSRALCEAGIDVLAHPWRYFRRAKRPAPKHLYRELTDILAGTDTAAEINYHTNDPDPAFFAECIARGGKIVLASDCHHVTETGAFRLHLDCLRAAAGRDADLASVLLGADTLF